jgi:hypothetical protein
MAKPTKTTNRIHFTDLEHRRFEDLCLAMVYRLSRWSEISHPGRSGKDHGIDILAVEELENLAKRKWFIQAKRYQSIGRNDLTQVVNDATKNDVPDILLLVVACDVSKTKSDYFIQYAKSKGVTQPLIWPASILEAQLYARYHDLLFTFFGISLSGEKKDRIATVRRNIDLNRRMRRNFLLDTFNHHEEMQRPFIKFKKDRVIVRSIDDDSYPVVVVQPGISPWFKVNLHDFYHNGLEVMLTIVNAIFYDDGRWEIVKHSAEGAATANPQSVKLYQIGRIPFENIIDYDLQVNEFGDGPHIYCDFRNNGEPYEEMVYSAVSESDGKGGFTCTFRPDNSKRIRTE